MEIDLLALDRVDYGRGRLDYIYINATPENMQIVANEIELWLGSINCNSTEKRILSSYYKSSLMNSEQLL